MLTKSSVTMYHGEKKTFTHFSKYVCLSPLFNYYKINEA